MAQPEAALAVWQQALQPEDVRTTLLEHIARIVQAQEHSAAEVLHVGCGAYSRAKLPPVFSHAGWREVRLDIDPTVQPDLVASITDMRIIPNDRFDAVYSFRNVEHLYPHEVPAALQEMLRVLKPSGFALIRLPDLQEVARHVADGNLDAPLYLSPMGPIAPLDIMYGHRDSLASGNLFMAHHTGFIDRTLGAALIQAGFAAALVQRHAPSFSLTAIAFKSKPSAEGQIRAQAQMLLAEYPAVLFTGIK
jgi:SAM-dependent methyltransferase